MDFKIGLKTERYMRMRHLFILVECMIYLSFLILDIFNNSSGLSEVLKFMGVIFCCVYAAYKLCFCRDKKDIVKDRVVVISALSFTLLADSQLLYEGNYFLGICFFIIVQLIYLYRISYRGIVSLNKAFFINIIGIVIALVIVGMFIPYEKSIYAVSIYMTIFIGNIIRLYKIKSIDTLFFIGMVLFLLCDINVGIYNLNSYIIVNNSFVDKLIACSGMFMWVFYLPSQVLITLSLDVRSQW